MSSCAGRPDAMAELVFIPAPLSGHFFSMIEMAKLLATRDHRLSLTILIINIPIDANVSAYASSLAAASNQDQSIRFVVLPQLDIENSSGSTDAASSSIRAKLLAVISRHKPLVRDAVTELVSNSVRLAGFVIDMLCTPMIDTASEFGLPTYLYYTSSIAMLALSRHLRALYDEGNQLALAERIDSDAELTIPGFINSLPVAKLFPDSVIQREESDCFLYTVGRFEETKGILVNSFAELEPYAVSAFRHAECGGPTVYPVGPILNLDGGVEQGSRDEQTMLILSWLDGQPPSSVVFLCFGSMGSFSAEQVEEIAIGLERSGHRFLWSLRRQPSITEKIQPGECADAYLKEVLPKGFLERTAGFGKVIGWAPQAAVLSHPAAGGFVSHCGWNSILESLWFGVPTATWPVYAEQPINAFTLVKELGLATELTLDYRRNLFSGVANFIVSREDVERGVRSAMETQSGVREKVKVMREASRKALTDEGSSYSYLGRFIKNVFTNIP